MLVQGIPSTQVVNKIAKRNKDYELDFINTDSNSDMYKLQVYLRRNSQENNEHYKIRLVLTSSILAYPALEMTWAFNDDEYETASNVYHRICNEVDDAKTDYDRSMMPAATLAAKIKEAVKPIAISRQEKFAILPIDEINQMVQVPDWRMSIYSGRYPNMSREEKKQQPKFEGNVAETEPKRTIYPGRRQ